MQFYCSGAQFFETCLGAYRSLFLIEKSNAARKFSIEDGAYVERSQKSFKVGEHFSYEKWRIMCLKAEHFFGFFVLGRVLTLAWSEKLHVHAPRDGTAAGWYGGAAREDFIFSWKLYLGLFLLFLLYWTQYEPYGTGAKKKKHWRALTMSFDYRRANS